MDIAYIVKIRVSAAIYAAYKMWLQVHIEGNTSEDIKGMMEIHHNGKVLFPSVEIFTSDPISGFHLMVVKYYTDSIENINEYLTQYASGMRGELPKEFESNTFFNRYIGKGSALIPVGIINEEMEDLYKRHEDEIYNLASFEVYG